MILAEALMQYGVPGRFFIDFISVKEEGACNRNKCKKRRYTPSLLNAAVFNR
jgi:hypothetical protein